MNASAAKTPASSHLRFWLWVAVIFGAHVGAVFLFEGRGPIPKRQSISAPQLRLAVGGSEFLELNNPTLLALPHPRGFSGPVWMHRTRILHEGFEWNEPQRWQALPVDQMGRAFLHFMTTNAWRKFSPEIKATPQLNVPSRILVETNVTASSLRMDGELSSRSLVNLPLIPPWPNTELLTDTIIRVLVDDAGNIISRTLRKSSGSKDADNFAMNAARTIRFAPLPSNASQSQQSWTGGLLIFEWFTVPPSPTNSVPQTQ